MIICAAIKFHLYKLGLGDKNGDIIITGLRHSNCFETIRDLGLKPEDYKELEQGFITNKNEFLNRKLAYSEALMCGQLSATTRQIKSSKHENELFSEDLY